MSRINGRSPGKGGAAEPAWDREGCIENIMAEGINLYHYTDFGHGVSHYVLVMFDDEGGEAYKQERRFNWGDSPEAQRVMDGIQNEWRMAKMAEAQGDQFNALAFTYRGLRLIFPTLPEDPTSMRGTG